MSSYTKLIGVKNGIFTLLEIKKQNLGVFQCDVCKSTHEGNIAQWKYQSRKKCGRKNTNHRLYDRYSKMIKRCYDKNNGRYNYYGARGIKVCDRWLESFNNFLDDMEDSFKEGLELDRIDNNGNYSPENCRWVTHSENMLNRKCFDNKTGFHGVKKTRYNTFIGRCQINKKSYRTKSYKNPEDACKAIQELRLTLISEMR